MLCPVSDAWRTMELRGGEGSGAKAPPRPRCVPGAGGVSVEGVGHAGLLFGVERVDQVTESLEERVGGGGQGLEGGPLGVVAGRGRPGRGERLQGSTPFLSGLDPVHVGVRGEECGPICVGLHVQLLSLIHI